MLGLNEENSMKAFESQGTMSHTWAVSVHGLVVQSVLWYMIMAKGAFRGWGGVVYSGIDG